MLRHRASFRQRLRNGAENTHSHRTGAKKKEVVRLFVFNCPICYGELETTDIVTTGSCAHQFCRECVLNYLNDRINNSNVLTIPCPQARYF
jgi:hypothetical protein